MGIPLSIYAMREEKKAVINKFEKKDKEKPEDGPDIQRPGENCPQ